GTVAPSGAVRLNCTRIATGPSVGVTAARRLNGATWRPGAGVSEKNICARAAGGPARAPATASAPMSIRTYAAARMAKAIIPLVERLHRAVEVVRELVGDPGEREPALGGGDQALAPQAVLERHGVGLAEEQRDQALEPRPAGERAAMVVGRHARVD